MDKNLIQKVNAVGGENGISSKNTGGLARFAKKSLGQNFLKSEKALSQIVEAGDIKEGDLIVEIGPGEGALTGKILEKINTLGLESTRLVVIEKDDRLIPILEEKFSEYSDTKLPKKLLTIIHGDIIELLKGDLLENISIGENQQSVQSSESPINTHRVTKPNTSYKIIANIPYYITGLIIRNIFEQKNLPEKVVLLVQKEVADRMVARGENGKTPTEDARNGAKESLLSLSVKIYGTPRRVAIVPRGAFVPSPTVDSAIISIEKIERKISQEKEPVFFEMLHAAFAHKRKRLVKNLADYIVHTHTDHTDHTDRSDHTTSSSTHTKNSLPSFKSLNAAALEKILEELHLDKNVRAEDLSVEKYIQLLDRLI